jgi:hypothetical protein
MRHLPARRAQSPQVVGGTAVLHHALDRHARRRAFPLPRTARAVRKRPKRVLPAAPLKLPPPRCSPRHGCFGTGRTSSGPVIELIVPGPPRPSGLPGGPRRPRSSKPAEDPRGWRRTCRRPRCPRRRRTGQAPAGPCSAAGARPVDPRPTGGEPRHSGGICLGTSMFAGLGCSPVFRGARSWERLVDRRGFLRYSTSRRRGVQGGPRRSYGLFDPTAEPLTHVRWTIRIWPGCAPTLRSRTTSSGPSWTDTGCTPRPTPSILRCLTWLDSRGSARAARRPRDRRRRPPRRRVILADTSAWIGYNRF